ncbi:helix-turn-helix domain-containing protein [Arthrobacter sp. I2-34]|uniref:Helix-turn-helix domain-containing protein n=1 Tax=Arthrobacter hankyongi TaxID=2904801 RepID=A0ABS9LCS9_9MICC|nr:helix-turn-helix domain-containing protein [Arthrobacter hankyongi]MCG2624450.1 helix-turn-helix domain-containing protein [Arthrobacter hankyongi]
MAPSSIADLILHPVRLRIIQALLGGRQLTTAEIAAELPDVAAATLYRHVGTLAKAGVLTVVHERPVRGTTERTYRLDLARTTVDDGELAGMSPEDHRRAFTAFIAGLLQTFDRYAAHGNPDLARDGAGYRQTALWLTDGELAELASGLRDVVRAAEANGPGQGRRRRIFSTVLIPADPPEQAPPA